MRGRRFRLSSAANQSLLAVTLASLLLAAGPQTAQATTLNVGDIAIVGFGPTNPDSFSIVPLVNLDSGTTVTLTDNGWQAAGGFRTGEGTLTYTAPSAIRAGTILNWISGGSSSSGFGTSTMSLNASGESFSVVSGTTVSGSTPLSSVLWALQSKDVWNADATSTSTSARPGIATTFTPAFANSDVAYNGATTAADKAAWQTRIGTTANFTAANSAVTMPTGAYSVTSNLTWNAGTNTTWDTATTNKNFTDGTNTTWFNGSDNVTLSNTGIGAVSVAAGGVSAGTMTISNASGTFSFSGGTISASSFAKSGAGTATISNALAGSAGLNVSGGTLTLSGANTYGGTTTVTGAMLQVSGSLGSTAGITVNSGGTLLLNGAGNDRLNNVATFTLNGGTFNLGGVTEGAAGVTGIGAMILSANSTLDFGTTGGSNVVQFGSVGTHGASTLLSVLDYEYGTDHLYFAGNDLTSFTNTFSQSDISFNGIGGYAAVQFGGYFEIVAVPEPATVFGALGLLAFVGWRERRRFSDCLRRSIAR